MNLGSKGKIWFGIISIQITNVESSLPDENYAGILMDINLTLHGTTRLSAVPIPFMFLATSFETTNLVYLQMEFFWGAVHKSSDSTSVDGFARMVTWEW